jgi:hypothetical protein
VLTTVNRIRRGAVRWMLRRESCRVRVAATKAALVSPVADGDWPPCGSRARCLRANLQDEMKHVRIRGERGFQRGWWRPRQRPSVRRLTATSTDSCASRQRLPALLDGTERYINKRRGRCPVS